MESPISAGPFWENVATTPQSFISLRFSIPCVIFSPVIRAAWLFFPSPPMPCHSITMSFNRDAVKYVHRQFLSATHFWANTLITEANPLAEIPLPLKSPLCPLPPYYLLPRLWPAHSVNQPYWSRIATMAKYIWRPHNGRNRCLSSFGCIWCLKDYIWFVPPSIISK